VFFFVLGSLCRFACSIGFLDRPLVLGCAGGLLIGDVATGLKVGLFFELIWLDLFPAGTFIPPNGAASTLCGLALIHYFALSEPNQIALVLALVLPLGLLAARLEGSQRTWQNAGYNEILHWARRDTRVDSPPERIVARSVGQLVGLYGLAFLASLVLLLWLTGLLLPLIPKPHRFQLTWAHLWFVASLGGLVSLRIRRVYGALLVTVLGCTLLLFLAAMRQA
jgi:PTS system mannose-specific IIC component